MLSLLFSVLDALSSLFSLSPTAAKLPYCAHSSNQCHENSGLGFFELLPTTAAAPRWRLRSSAPDTSFCVPQPWKRELAFVFLFGFGFEFRFVCQMSRERLAETHDLCNHHRRWIKPETPPLATDLSPPPLLVRVLDSLGIGFSLGDKRFGDFLFLIWVWKVGFGYGYLWIYGYFFYLGFVSKLF